MGKSSKNLKDFGAPAAKLLPVALVILVAGSSRNIGFSAAQSTKTLESAIPVQYTDVSESAKITCQQDSTSTDEKRYLETMGTGVAWIDHDQDGLIDLYLRSVLTFSPGLPTSVLNNVSLYHAEVSYKNLC